MKTVMSVRFNEQTVKKIQAAAEDSSSNPAALIRKAVEEFLENLNGEGLEARLAARLEALTAALAALPAAVADEIEARRKAALAAKQAREAANVQ